MKAAFTRQIKSLPHQAIQSVPRRIHLSCPSLNPSSTRAQPPKSQASSPRVYPARKQFIYESYLHLFTQHQVCLLFRHDSLTPKEWNYLRGQLAKLSQNEAPEICNTHTRIEVLRTKMILPVLKHLLKEKKLNRGAYKAISSHLQGNLASITQPTIHPAKLRKAIEIISKQSAIPSKAQITQLATVKASDDPVIIDRLPFVVGLIDGRAYSIKAQLEEISRLPDLKTLQHQIVGLIGNVGHQLVANLDVARGRTLVGTLDGYRAYLDSQPILLQVSK